MKWHLKELIGKYESKSGQRLNYRDMAATLGISTNTITQIATNKARRADLATVDKLLGFFSGLLGEELAVDDLLKRYPDIKQ